MKRVGLFLISFFILNTSFGQIINTQTGISISNLDWESWGDVLEAYDNNIIGYSFFLGVDYFDKKYYNLSNNIGYLRKGGEGVFIYSIGTYGHNDNVTEKAELDYLTINTLIDFKFPIKGIITPYISIGPRFDYLIKSKMIGITEVKKYNYGFVIGGGIKYNLSSKINIGIRSDYYLNFEEIAEYTQLKITDNTYTINLTIGYKLR